MNEEQKNFKKDGIMQIEEYEFPHCIIDLSGEQNGDQLNEGYNRCRDFLQVHKDQGFTLLVAPKWMFLAPLGQPYIQKDGVPVYLDGYSYTGIVDIQLVKKTWPATANLEDDTTYILDAFKKSAEFTPEPEPVEDSKPATP